LSVEKHSDIFSSTKGHAFVYTSESFHADQEDTIGKPAKTTLAKRDREKAKQMKQREKEARRVQRKAEKTDRPQTTGGEDPDLAGLHWGPQEPLY
jgi:phage/plasmid-associated DNA primase